MENKDKTVFNSWKSLVEEQYGQRRFLSQCRDEVIGMLFEKFLEFGVSLEDAQTWGGEVEEFLVTKEGKKGKGKYKGWNENVEKDFDTALIDYYKNNYQPETKTLVLTKDYGKHPYMPRNPIVTAWAQDHFGVAWNEDLNLLVHMHGHRFNQDFQKEVLDSDWARSGNNTPAWATALFN